MQKVLDERIEKEHPRHDGEDRFAKKILSLQVELGELANEWRGFKFWKVNQDPVTYRRGQKWVEGKCETFYSNPLLDEYVDCLHFILSIGFEQANWITNLKIRVHTLDDTQKQFKGMYKRIVEFEDLPSSKMYDRIFGWFIGLGEMLGFTWEQIEQAYIKKNEVNHERQATGY